MAEIVNGTNLSRNVYCLNAHNNCLEITSANRANYLVKSTATGTTDWYLIDLTSRICVESVWIHIDNAANAVPICGFKLPVVSDSTTVRNPVVITLFGNYYCTAPSGSVGDNGFFPEDATRFTPTNGYRDKGAADTTSRLNCVPEKYLIDEDGKVYFKRFN